MALEDRFKEEDVQEIEEVFARILSVHEATERHRRQYGYWGDWSDFEGLDHA